jgi:hypothetical protein
LGRGGQDGPEGEARAWGEKSGRLWPTGQIGGSGLLGEKIVFQILFSNKFQITVSNHILSKKMTFSGNGPKIKVA